MAKTAAGTVSPGGKSGVRIVVVGDPGTGKSSLIVTAAGETFPENAPPVLAPTRLPEDYYPDHVPVTIIDTSSKVEDSGKVAEELKRADAVVLTYACNNTATLDRLSTFWLPELRRLEVKVPIIVVGCKLDLIDENQQVSLEQVMSPIRLRFQEIQTCIECSAFKHIENLEVFYYAQKAVLHPIGPLFDQETQTLKPRCVRALKRIFNLCDRDRDGALNDAELNDFQVKCFNAPLKPLEIVRVKRIIVEKLLGEGAADGRNNKRGLTLTGFLFLHALLIQKGRLDATWTVLRKFGYDNEIKLADELIPSFKRAPDQSTELTSEAVKFLKGVYELFDSDHDNNLQLPELEDLFSSAPENPWTRMPYKDAVQKTASGSLSINAFLSEWALMALLEPSRAVENLIYIGYPGDPTTAICVTRNRGLDRKKQQSERNVLQGFVFGPKNAGKSALLSSFIGRSFPDKNISDAEDNYAVNMVDLSVWIKKTLVLREIYEDGVKKLLSYKESLASCDIAIFVYDRTIELLLQVANHGERTGFEVPCLLVAAKDDLNSFHTAVQKFAKVNQKMGIEAPIPIFSKRGDTNNVFSRIVSAAEHPYLSIPETKAGRTLKRYRRLVNCSLMCVSVGATVAVVGLAAYRAYATRKSSSS